MDKCVFTPELNEKVKAFLETPSSEDEETAAVMDIIKRMSPEDAIRLVLFMAKVASQVCDTKFFVKFSKYFSDLTV